MRITWKTLLAAFFIVIPCSYHIWSASDPTRVLGESIALMFLLVFPVSGADALRQWVASGSSLKEQFGRAFKLFLVSLSLLLVVAVWIGGRAMAH